MARNNLIKYGVTGFDEMNNFCNWSFLKFEMKIELKIWEFKVYFWL
jgi:hypothetical protein